MKLLLDDNKIIIGMAVIGSIEGAIDYSGSIPDGFEEQFKPNFYMIKDNSITENPDYVAPEPPATKPSVIEQQLATLGYKQMQDTQYKQALIKQNAQMAYQIMKIQQQLGGQKA
ncbi:DUF2977 domain-containing protein [Pediococcus pentosaceus]|uniref:DUF2977 domain-containing protein n=1 Tax=Pediococcus pentosaceus TaxID=1255 RepID=UPI00132FBED1|nr:DUF2977 domain-containing protein [Pediococcus pentosaceus]KAF0505256.1 DUF2977 domain-containing protein [Pediococcus pentosaceus]MCT1175791.1 DUF2977 domain-containing protein [Pediococcus pentosaceus]